MKDELVSFKTAALAKEKGFQDLCFYYYDNKKLCSPYLENGSSTDTDFMVDLDDLLENHNYKHLAGKFYSAPTHFQLQTWLRKTYNIRFKIEPTISDRLEIFYHNSISWVYIGIFDTDQEATEQGLKLVLSTL